MLLTKDLIKDVEEKYVAMLKMVNIPDFTKCIAQFSGLDITEVSDSRIKEYLLLWAKNKYRFFKTLGDKLRYDTSIKYEASTLDIMNAMDNLSAAFPSFTPWLLGFHHMKQNKIDLNQVGGSTMSWLEKFGKLSAFEGTSLTRFFKYYLNAPDALISRISDIYEKSDNESYYTLSIDPVEMMLASESPYPGWTSCYRLEHRSDSHADGCIAALLDSSHMIAYLWEEEGKFILYNKYHFSSIRYKIMRQWVSISPTMKSIYFCQLQPTKFRDRENLEKALRQKVEDKITKYLNIENKWRKAEETSVERENDYGYNEYYLSRAYEHSSVEESESWMVFEEAYKCPCGCMEYLVPSCDVEDEYEDEAMYYFTGEGFNCCSFQKNEICPHSGIYCRWAAECGNWETCQNCYWWKQDNPVCSLDCETRCYENGNVDDDGVAQACSGECEGCPYWEDHIAAMKEDENEE